MKYLLNANTCIRILNSSDEGVPRRFTACQPADIVLCSVVKAELLYGARRSARVEFNLRRLAHFAAPLQSLSFDDQSAHEYGLIRADLATVGKPIGANDLLIAAIARAHKLILVTHNLGEFERVQGLRVEDWEEDPTNQSPSCKWLCKFPVECDKGWEIHRPMGGNPGRLAYLLHAV